MTASKNNVFVLNLILGLTARVLSSNDVFLSVVPVDFYSGES